MVIPSRKNQMIKKMIQNVKSMKTEISKEEKEKKKPVNEKEHQRRINMLKKIGFLK